jgi:hypothetical protein
VQAHTPAGHRLTIDAPDDHPWHHALWCTIKFVDDVNFWEELGDVGRLDQDQPPQVARLDGGAERATSTLRWVRPDDDVAVDEHLVLTHHPVDGGTHALDWDVTLTPVASAHTGRPDTVFDRTPFTTWGGYGGLTLRGRPDWHDTSLRLPDGEPRQRVLGDPAPWCALEGPLAAEGADARRDDPVVGVAVFDHPANPRFPTPWYASTRADTYGDEGWSNFCNAAFLWDDALRVPAGEQLRLRHRVLAYDGRRDADHLAAEWDRWLAEAGGPPGAAR